MTMRALVSADRPVVRIWHLDNPKVYVEIQFESRGRAVEWDVEVRDRAGVRRRRPVLTQANSEFPGVRPRLAELGAMS